MAYTVGYLYTKFLDKLDKSGSTIISPDQMMELLQTCTLGFIEGVYKYNENTSQWRDLLTTLYAPYEINLLQNPSNAEELIGTIPESIMHIDTAKVIDTIVTVRSTKIIRKGELEARKSNPNQRPTGEYPHIVIYGNTIACYGSVTATKVQGFSLNKPTFGDPLNEENVSVNLPDHTVEMILHKMVTEQHTIFGDQRIQPALLQESKYGKL